MTINRQAPQDLLDAASTARENAYARYSAFRVGAAIRDESGHVFAGCNVENASYPEGQCAETSAIGAMVTGGGSKICEVLVIGGFDDIGQCSPCGGCRQRIIEFAEPDCQIWLIDEQQVWRSHTFTTLLPASFAL